jgi:cytochrome c peroxidase
MPYALEGIRQTLEQIATDRSKDKALKSINLQIDTTISILKKNNDKNTFDYASFIPDHLNPLASLLLDFQKQEKIENVDVTTALNKSAATFYSKNAFNPDAFSPGKQYAYSEEKAALGKKLFNDKILSNNNNRSCATCHIAEKAFTDGLPQSMSLGNTALARNAPSLNYSGFQHGQFWDMRKDDLEGQSSDVISIRMKCMVTFIPSCRKSIRIKIISQNLKRSIKHLKLRRGSFRMYWQAIFVRWQHSILILMII